MAKIMTKTVYLQGGAVLRPGDTVPEGVVVNPRAYIESSKASSVVATAAVGSSLEDLTKAQLVEMAKARDVPHSGTKNNLIERLSEA